MKRILALDVGKARIGVAISDDLGITAQGLPTISYESSVRTVRELQDIVNSKDVGTIVVGLPKSLDGSLGTQAQYVLKFVDMLKSAMKDLVIDTWDERFSTQGAERVLIDSGLNSKKRKKYKDMLSAQWILQGYLERLRMKKEE